MEPKKPVKTVFRHLRTIAMAAGSGPGAGSAQEIETVGMNCSNRGEKCEPVVSRDESDEHHKFRHSGLDPESSGALLDPGFRRDDVEVLLPGRD